MTSMTKFSSSLRGKGVIENKDVYTQILKIKLRSDGASFSDGDVDLKSYVSNLYTCLIIRLKTM